MKKIKLNQKGISYAILPVLLSLVAIGVIGAYVISKSDAARPGANATGTINITSNGDLSTPFSVSFTYSKSVKQLERPFVQFECYRDIDGDGRINNTPFTNSKDLVYAYQVYLVNSYVHPDYPVTITSSNREGLSGTASAKLLSGSSQLVSTLGDAQCQASLQEWDANVRQETYPIIYATTPLTTLKDPRVTN